MRRPPIAFLRAVVSSSRGNQTKVNNWALRMLRTWTNAGRGRSASDIAIITS